MRKYLLILVLALIGFSCSQENEFNGNNSNSNGFQVSAEFIDLSAGTSNEQAGTIKVQSDEDEVQVRWISDASFNLDTTQTSVSMENGQGVLPIKWQSKLDDGTYAPANIRFKAGVVISSGKEEKYIPIYHVEQLDSADVLKRIQTRAALSGEARAASIKLDQAAPIMTENGVSVKVSLLNIADVSIGYSSFKPIHNIDLNRTDLPTYMVAPGGRLNFNWKDESVRPAAFALPVVFSAFELDVPVSFTLVWNPDKSRLIVNPDQHEVSYNGGVVSSLITCKGSWIANKGPESWFSIDKASEDGNGTLQFTVAKNDGEARSATVTIISGSESREIVINQVAKEPELTIDPVSHSVANTGGTVTSTISSNGAWTATKGTEEWFTMTPVSGKDDGSIEFTVSPNNSLDARSAQVTVTSGGKTEEITILQAGQNVALSVNPENHSIGSAGKTVTSTIECNTDWSATKGTESWITLDKTSGNGDGSVSITVAANTTLTSRSATVTVKAGDKTKEITISQAALVVSLNVNPENHLIESAGKTVTSTIECNTDWSVTKGTESWITLDKASGSGDGSVSITVAANTALTSRSATVTVKAGDKTKEITISQAELVASLAVNPKNHSIESAGKTVTSTIKCNTSWTAIKGLESWITLNKTSGNGDGSILITVAANTTFSARSATVTIKAGTSTENITISQAAASVILTVNPANHSVAKTGGTVTSTISCNTSWTAAKGLEDWITLDKTDGSGDGAVSITVAANTTWTSRSATVTVKAGTSTNKITISQAAGRIEVAPGGITTEDWDDQTNQEVDGGEI